jgi:hypothetical protein
MSLEHAAVLSPKSATRSVLPLAAPAPLPSPEQVLADWLRWIPQGVDISAAARAQIAALDRHGSKHPDIQYLRMLLVAVAGGRVRHPPFNNL